MNEQNIQDFDDYLNGRALEYYELKRTANNNEEFNKYNATYGEIVKALEMFRKLKNEQVK